MNKFEQECQRLNENQRLAVDTLEGPVMVVAGPGTGKTQVLTLRIANLIKTGVAEPENILALTFTNAAASNMQKRLVKIIGTTGYRVRICTFHAFCSAVINDRGEYFPFNQKSEALSDLATYEIFEDILTELRLQKLRSTKQKFYYLKDIISSISTLKREGVSAGEFEKIVALEQQEFTEIKSQLKKTELSKRENNLKKWADLVLIYHQYQNILAQKNLFDYSDMINLVKEAFSAHEELLLTYQEQFQYLLVDEYQDTNSAQDSIVDLLTSYWQENANIFVVGDPNQSIYRFQGASLENYLGFISRYPKARVIGLNIGYRCTQNTYDIAAALINRDEFVTPTGKKIALPQLKNFRGESGTKLQINSYVNRDLEISAIVDQIKTLHGAGVNYQDIAILYKKNSEAEAISEVLSINSIPIEVEGDTNVLEEEKVKQFTNLLKLITVLDKPHQANQLLYEVIQYDWLKIPLLPTLRLATLAHENKEKIVNYFYDEQKLTDLIIANNLEAEDFQPLHNFWLMLINQKQKDINHRLHKTVLTIFNEVGLLENINQSENRLILLSSFYTFINHVRDLERKNPDLKLKDLIKTLAVMNHHQLKIKIQNLSGGEDAVHLSTVHKAKGCEWQYVFVTGIVDKNWGNERDKNNIKLPSRILKFEQAGAMQNEETKRLLYVAITRAQNKVLLSYPETTVEENRQSEKLPSEFLQQIEGYENLVESNHFEGSVEEVMTTMTNCLTQPSSFNCSETERAYFKKIVENFVLSPSSLNAYLFDKTSFINNYLLHAPQLSDNEANLSFGLAFHATVHQLLTPKLKNETMMSLEDANRVFSSELEKKNLEADDHYYFHKVGLQYLKIFYENNLNHDHEIISLEKNFGGSYPIIMDGVKITGKIDRIDLYDHHEVAIIDYKTGSPKTIREICSLGKGASDREVALEECLHGSYKRQLLFYKILSEADPKFKYNATHGILDFVIGDDHKKPVQRVIEFQTEEIEAMKKLIKQADIEIRELKFLEEN